MALFNCLYPRVIKNPYTGVQTSVRCGKCDACRNLRADNWVKRLDMESDCHKFTYFFTLTYDDFNVNQIVRLPYEYKFRNSFQYIDSETGEIFDTFDIKDTFEEKDIEYCKNSDVINVLSKRDFQLFIKRLRYYFDKEEKGALLRYYICGELGPRTFRPHGHCLLFFDSEKCARNLSVLLSKSWVNEYKEPLGSIYDPHPVVGSAAQYCASYVNSSSKLPRVYLHPRLRPFTMFSKCPAIGSLYPSIKEVRKVFDSGDIKFRRFRKRDNSFEDVYFWRSFEDRLFPRCQRFSSLVSSDRITLYRLIQEFPSYLTSRQVARRIKQEYIDSGRQDFLGRYFKEIAFKTIPCLHYCKQPISLGWKLKDLPFLPLNTFLVRDCAVIRSSRKEYRETSLIRFVNTLRRVQYQAQVFLISIDDYVNRIENYYEKKSAQKLKDDYLFQDDYFKFHPKWHYIYFDKSFYDKVKQVEYSALSLETKKTLSFLFDGSIPLKDGFVDIPDLDKLDCYQTFYLLHKKIAYDMIKQKENNDYALSKGDKFNNVLKYQYG